jgi:hypothetical protein
VLHEGRHPATQARNWRTKAALSHPAAVDAVLAALLDRPDGDCIRSGEVDRPTADDPDLS